MSSYKLQVVITTVEVVDVVIEDADNLREASEIAEYRARSGYLQNVETKSCRVEVFSK